MDFNFSIFNTVKKSSFSLRISSVNLTKPQFPSDWSHLLKKPLMENVIFCAVSFFNSAQTNEYESINKAGTKTLLLMT